MMDCEVEGEILTPEDFTKDSGWQLVAARRSTRRRNAAANQTGADVVEVQPNAGSNARCRPDHAGIKSKIIRGGRMPPLPKEEAKIIVRPRGGLCISKVGPTAVADAIWQAAGLDSATRDTDTIRSRSRERSRSRGRTRSRTVSRSRSGSRVRYKSRSRSGSRGRQGSRAQPSSGPESASTGCGRQPTLVWADLVRPKPGANTGAAPAPRNDPPPEQARDSEVIRLRKENDDLKNTINRLVKAMAEIKKLVSNASGNDAAVRASETPIPAPVDGTATSSKRRAVVNQTCESGVLSAEVSEIKQTLTALADSLKQVAPSVRQIQVALGDPKRGLGALADRIDAIEARMASSATVVQPLLREARLKYPTSAPTEGPILCAALTAPLGGCPSATRSHTVDVLVSKLIQKYLPIRRDGDPATQLPDYRGPPRPELDEDFSLPVMFGTFCESELNRREVTDWLVASL
ncbi:hypothetical protein HPB49_024550 [Dermacentor silvarum]|uniref:Uncharacterized protein n=1 Tax=Dermacentor silvarum TaxID=543639 RepID=A0ACB8CNM8_DERSI|nr:hypothetical protein HPB49_024550 [Dermacentor silvarum]